MLRLLVDGDIERAVCDSEADWHNVRNPACVGGREMSYPPCIEEAPLS
jgi:hypothetical protein